MERHIKIGIGVMLLKEGKVLLGHRVVKGEDTGGIYEPDSWCLPGGKQEYDETIYEGARREVKEETNIEVEELEVFHVADDIQPDKHFVTIQMIARSFKGEAQIMEPDKMDEWQWFSLDHLPDNIYSPSEKFITEYLKRTKAYGSFMTRN